MRRKNTRRHFEITQQWILNTGKEKSFSIHSMKFQPVLKQRRINLSVYIYLTFNIEISYIKMCYYLLWNVVCGHEILLETISVTLSSNLQIIPVPPPIYNYGQWSVRPVMAEFLHSCRRRINYNNNVYLISRYWNCCGNLTSFQFALYLCQPPSCHWFVFHAALPSARTILLICELFSP